jgi:hypothetical protein
VGTGESTLNDQLQNTARIESELARTIVDVLLIKNRASGPQDLSSGKGRGGFKPPGLQPDP